VYHCCLRARRTLVDARTANYFTALPDYLQPRSGPHRHDGAASSSSPRPARASARLLTPLPALLAPYHMRADAMRACVTTILDEEGKGANWKAVVVGFANDKYSPGPAGF